MITWTTWIYFVQSAWEADRSLNKKYTYLPDAFPFLKSDKVVLNHYPDISRDARSNPSGFIVSMTTILLFCVLFREFEPASLWKLWSPSSGPLWPFTPCSRRDCSDWLKLAEANFLSFYLFIYFYCVKAKLTNETIMLQNFFPIDVVYWYGDGPRFVILHLTSFLTHDLQHTNALNNGTGEPSGCMDVTSVI